MEVTDFPTNDLSTNEALIPYQQNKLSILEGTHWKCDLSNEISLSSNLPTTKESDWFENNDFFINNFCYQNMNLTNNNSFCVICHSLNISENDSQNRFIQLAKNKSISIIGSYNPDKCGCTISDFYDGMHPKDYCINNIISNH
jgi:hypothetical protein